MNEKEINRLKDDLTLRLELLAQKFELLNKKKWFQENETVAISC